MKKDVSLALSSGGPRGWAYIGAIEELENRGYRITSIAGTSIGSLIGGIYAAGKLHEVKEWLYSLDVWNVFTLMDLSISKNHLVKGDKVISALKEIVPDVNIEDLPIPYRAVAADLYTGEEVVFDRGPLFEAIRASISIPSLFRPVKYGFRTLVDGGIVNTLPINKLVRHDNDLLVAFDVNDIDVDSIREMIIHDARMAEDRRTADKQFDERTKTVMNAIRNNKSLSLADKFKLIRLHGQELLSHKFGDNDAATEMEAFEQSYYSILSRTFSIMNHVIAKNAVDKFRPDILAKLPFDAFDEISDYARAKEISETGREIMKKALDMYETVR